MIPRFPRIPDNGLLVAPLIFILSGTLQYSGAAVAVSQLFPIMSPVTVAWWRVTVSGIVLLAFIQPWRRTRSPRDLIWSLFLGWSIAGMNMVFYAAIDRINLGTCVSIEFIGPVAVALWQGYGIKIRIAAILALAGVASISGLGLDLSQSGQRLGLLLALAAGLGWALYILIGQRRAQAGNGLDCLAWGFFLASVTTSPIVGTDIGSGWQSGFILICCLAVGILSSALPFPLEQISMKRVGPDIFALFSCLMPAMSELIGFILLGHAPNLGELLGFVLISAALALIYLKPGMFRRLPKTS